MPAWGKSDKAYATVKSILDKIPENVLTSLKPTSPEPAKAKQAYSNSKTRLNLDMTLRELPVSISGLSKLKMLKKTGNLFFRGIV